MRQFIAKMNARKGCGEARRFLARRNTPREMADADFGYVGGAPGKINLYVGKTPIKFNIPEAEAVERLVDLIREHGKWVEPEQKEPVLQS